MKAAKLEIRLILPELARPPAIPTRLLSAIPMLKKRSGYFLPNHSVRVELLTSASTTTTSVWSAPSASRARPNASRVALPSSRFDFNAEVAPAMSSLPSSRDRRAPVVSSGSAGGVDQGQGLVEVLRRHGLAVEIEVAELRQERQDA